MKVAELFEAKAMFKLYTEHPYGNGLMKTSVAKGEVLTSEKGDDGVFAGITADGKKVIIKVDGENREVSPEDVGGKILPADQKPGGEGFEKGRTNPRKWV